MRQKLRLMVLASVVALSTGACVSQNVVRQPSVVVRPSGPENRPIEIKPTSVFRGQIRNATVVEDRFIRETLARLEQNVIDAIPMVAVCDEAAPPPCFSRRPDFVAGHIHIATSQICIFRLRLYECNLWHEAIHAWEFRLRTLEPKAVSRWKFIAGDVYGGKLAGASLPRAGVLSESGAVKYEDDLAEWGKAAYCYAYDRPNALAMVSDFSDSRYLQKLEFLRTYRFIGEGVYRKAKGLIVVGLQK